jgi:hypothetical protein
MAIQSYRGRINFYNLLLGSVALLCVGAMLVLFFLFGVLPELTCAALLVALPVGLGVIYAGVRHRFTTVTLSPTAVQVNGEQIEWANLSRVVERSIRRYWRFMNRTFLLKSLRQLELHSQDRRYPMIISSDWLSAADYTAVYQRIEQERQIEELDETSVG